MSGIVPLLGGIFGCFFLLILKGMADFVVAFDLEISNNFEKKRTL